MGRGGNQVIIRIAVDCENEVTHWWQELALTLAYGRIPVVRQHDVPESAAMNIIWYPGCGQDFNPVLTLLRSNPRRDHVLERGPKDEGPILWMTDYCPEAIRCFDGLEPGDPLSVSPFQALDGLVGGLRVQVGSHDGIWLQADEVEIQDVRRFNFEFDGVAMARRESERRWAENWGGDQNWQAEWDVTEMVLESSELSSLGVNEPIKVWFSPYEPEAALRYVFGPQKVRLHCVVLVRLGGFSCQRHRPGRELDHHDRKFFALLSRHARATGTRLPDYVLTDKNTSRWCDPDPYMPTGVGYEGWMGPVTDHGPGVRLFRKRDGIGAGHLPCIAP